MDPATMAMLAAAGAQALGKLIAGVGGYVSGVTQSKALKAKALNVRAETGVRANIQMEANDRIAARAATLAAASGGGLGGSAAAVIDDLIRQGTHNARSIVRDGLTQVDALRFEAKQQRTQAYFALVTGGAGATGSALEGYAKATAPPAPVPGGA